MGGNGPLGIIIVILVIALIGCIIGVVLSINNQKKRKKLMNASDYTFKTKHGTYQFDYIIKGFKKDNLTLKVVINPTLGFSDLAHSGTNACLEVEVKGVNKATGEEVEETFIIKDMIEEMQQEEYDRLYDKYEKALNDDLTTNAKLIEHGSITKQAIYDRHEYQKPARKEDLLIQKTTNFRLNPTISIDFPKELGGKLIDNDTIKFVYNK